MRISTLLVLAITAIGCSAHPTVESVNGLSQRGCQSCNFGHCNSYVWLRLYLSITYLQALQLTFSSAIPLTGVLEDAIAMGKLNQP
jgi:hypothetical protein